MAETHSFLPRILSVFYAVFHDNRGTNIIYQVPEGLIVTSPNTLNTSISNNTNRTSSPEKADGTSPAALPSENSTKELGGGANSTLSRASSSSRYSHLANSRETLGSSLVVRSSSANRYLFKFEDISRYVIPPSSLCGRLVTCTTRGHQIIGFPVELYNVDRYERNFFRYNVCLVFERTADLSCYEPIVRKIGRVLTTCEEESSFLTSPETSHKIHAILEQLFEDLNSYSETSIPIDKFNSIELKIFPFYPNPPDAHDWDVPVALINLKKRIEDNWDLTMAKVCQYIDGTNHVSRIAYLADCDLDLTRKAIQHLLFYQVIMMIDIFQFSNMYTLCRSAAWLADETHVRNECGPYVTRPDREISDWPDLLHLYSRLKPGVTVLEWMHEFDTHKHGIDPRRFVSFGVIKGFLRRVHRWPVLLPSSPTSPSPEKDKDRRTSSSSLSFGRRRGKSLTMPSNSSAGGTVVGPSSSGAGATPPPIFTGASAFSFLQPKEGAGTVGGGTGGVSRHPSIGEADRERHRLARRASAAEKYLEQFKREIDRDGAAGGLGLGGGTTGSVAPPGQNTSPRTQRYSRTTNAGEGRTSRKNSLVHQPHPTFTSGISSGGAAQGELTSKLGMSRTLDHHHRGESSGGGGETSSSGFATPTQIQTRPSSQATTILMPTFSTSTLNLSLASSGSTPAGAASSVPGHLMSMNMHMTGSGSASAVPSGLKELLDGTHHADELGVKFGLGWPALEKHLVVIGGGKGDGDFGRVEIIYR